MTAPSPGPDELFLDTLDAEPHVIQALSLTAASATGPCGAGEVLRAVAAMAGSVYSSAFRAFRALLPAELDLEAGAVPKVGQLRLSRGLDESWSRYMTAEPAPGRLWGRDLVTIALLADHDPSLGAFCLEAQVTIDGLQDGWFAFLHEDTSRPEAPDYRGAWRRAGLAAPDERGEAELAAFLAVPWSPGEMPTPRESNLARYDDPASGKPVTVLVNRRRLIPGDRLYVLDVEKGPARVVTMGVVESPGQGAATESATESDAELALTWLGADGTPPPAIEHEQLLTVDPEAATWSLGTTGLRLRPEVVAALDALLGPAAEAMTDNGGPDFLRYAKTLSDLDHKNDWIGIRPDVESLSTLVSVNQVKPPLSVAIFGDWGAGKTFLLRKIQERVTVLADLGRKIEAESEAAGETVRPDAARYCSSILQIEFNAWHYTESNLWASLVNTIFERIYDTLGGDRTAAAPEQQPVDELFENFETARHARQAAEEETRRLKEERKEAARTTGAAASAADQARDRLAATMARSVWTRLDELLHAEEGESAEQLDALHEALRHFGFAEALASARSIDETVGRFQSVSGRAREVFGSLVATPRGVAGAVVVAVLAAAIPLLARQFQVEISSLGAAVTAALAWLAERGATAGKHLNKIEHFTNWFAVQKQQAESERAREVTAARADLELKQAAVLAAQRREEEAAREEARARAELESLTARDQMRRFVDERVTTRAYAQHLGLVSMIRSDFEELTRFMHRDEETEEIELVNRIQAATLAKIPTIDRIVLYIDDLDRCQPDRVVEVLEAIHLLLAFRLFIVVVAVDPRWVLESLTQKYAHLRRARAHRAHDLADVAGGYHTAASAHDYLEKIFHIPFWVKPMAPQVCEKLIEGFLDLQHEPLAVAGTLPVARDEERFDSLETVDVEDLASGATAAQLNRGPARGNGGPGGPPASAPGREDAPPPAAMLKAEKNRRREEESIAAAAHIQTVVITEEEETFIRRLAPYVGNSPRRVKRFANSYRLIKSGLTRAESRRLNGDQDYRIVLAFLAVVTGSPNQAPGIFAEILRKRAGTLDLGAIIAELSGDGDPGREREVLSARGALGLLEGHTITQQQVEMWVPRVTRHAFRMIPGSLPVAREAAG